jgi:hypothetical protein
VEDLGGLDVREVFVEPQDDGGPLTLRSRRRPACIVSSRASSGWPHARGRRPHARGRPARRAGDGSGLWRGSRLSGAGTGRTRWAPASRMASGACAT